MSTLYQFGRKDAFSGTDTTPDGSFNMNGGDNMSVQNGIQHPEMFYTTGNSWTDDPPTGYKYYNLWSADNTVVGFNDNNVVKTVYDPCPAGFKMPASNAFTGFTTNGQAGGPKNVCGPWDYGWNFNNRIVSPNATVYFSAPGIRDGIYGSLYDVGDYGSYWSAISYNAYTRCYLLMAQWSVGLEYGNPSYGFSVHPVAE